jgi:hypothetical protein
MDRHGDHGRHCRLKVILDDSREPGPMPRAVATARLAPTIFMEVTEEVHNLLLRGAAGSGHNVHHKPVGRVYVLLPLFLEVLVKHLPEKGVLLDLRITPIAS